MRLYSPALVWRLRRAARWRVRQSRSLRRRSRWWRNSFKLERPAVYEPLLIILLASIVAIHQEKGSAWLLACLTLYCTATAIMRSRQLQALMTSSPERLLFYFYPLPDASFFHWALQGFLWKTSRVWLASGVAFAFVFGAGSEPWFWKAAAFATLEWLLTLAVILALAVYVYDISKWVPIGLYAAMIFVFYAGPIPSVAPAYPLLQFLPAGWIAPAIAMFHGRLTEWIALMTLISLAAAGVWTLIIRFRARIVVQDALEATNDSAQLAAPQVMGVLGEEEQLEKLLDEEEESESARPQTEWQRLRLNLVGARIENRILSGNWRKPWDWSAEPWLERLASGWLNGKEKKVAEFLLGDGALHWNELWRASVIAAAVAGVLFAVGLGSTLTLGILAAGLSTMLGVPVIGGSWPATSPGRLSGKQSPLHACYPLEYRTACRVMWKVNLVRTAAWLPVGTMLGALVGFSFGTGAGLAAWLVLKGTLVYVAAIPSLSAGHFSKSTNDTSNLRLATLPLMGLAVLFGLMFLAASITTMALSSAWVLVSFGAALTISLGAWWLYGWYYEQGHVDLLREPR